VRSVVSPLLPVLLTLALAALGLSLVFARLFPARAAAPAVAFTDVTAESGVRFTHQAGSGPAPTTLGAGVAVFDANGDGAPDLFFVGGAPWPWEASLGKRPGRGLALFRNDGRGRFTDVTAAAGLEVAMQGMAAVAGDFDADGRTDLFVTGIGGNRLFRNLGGGRFEDVTESAGVGGDATRWSTGAAWLDFDADGQLDLVVAHYARWPEDVGLAQAFAIANLGRSYGAPAGFAGAFPTVYRNLGDGRFAPVADGAGLRDVDPETRRAVPHALALATVDANFDGRIDLLFTYHAHPPALFLGQAGGRFVRLAPASPRQEGTVALLAAGVLASDAADEDPAGKMLFAWARGASADDATSLPARLGIAAADFDHDGRIEFFSGEGTAEAGPNRFDSGRDFGRIPAMLRSEGARWIPVPAPGGWSAPVTARGVATGDFDRDGDADVVIAQHGGPALLLRNEQRQGRPWLRLRLVATRSHPEAAGARVEVHTPRGVLRRVHAPALGLFAQSQPGLDFGLGDDARIRRLVIHWPSGQVQELPAPALNREHEVREP